MNKQANMKLKLWYCLIILISVHFHASEAFFSNHGSKSKSKNVFTSQLHNIISIRAVNSVPTSSSEVESNLIQTSDDVTDVRHRRPLHYVFKVGNLEETIR